MTWVFLVLAYGIIKGFREIFKKKALEKSSTIEVLFLYTFISFLIVIPEGKDGLSVEFTTLLFVALKSFTIFLAWICGFIAIQHMPVSLYGILDLSRVLFSTLLGVFVVGESMRTGQVIGLILVVAGLLLLKANKKKISNNNSSASYVINSSDNLASANNTKNSDNKLASVVNVKKSSDKLSSIAKSKTVSSDVTTTFFVFLAFGSAILNGVSGTMDKLLLTRTSISEGHLQFWYMLFLVLYYLIYILVSILLNKVGKSEKKFEFHLKSALKNYWIWILAIIFVIADRCLFIANSDPNSTVTVMTLIKQSSCIVTIVAGKLVFHEKNIVHKLICAAIIISGIVISVLC